VPESRLHRSPARVALDWLIGRDEAAVGLADPAFLAEVERNYRWNLRFNVLELGTYLFAISFISSGTILPLFLGKLTTNPLAFGLLALLAQGAWYLPQIFTAHLTEQLPRKLPIIVRLGFLTERLPLVLLTVAALQAVAAPGLSLGLLFVAYAWHGLGAGVIAPAWQELVGRCFPPDRRGRYMGIGSFVGTGTGVLGSGLSIWLLGALEFPVNFAVIFGTAAVTIALGVLLLAAVREPIPIVATTPQSPGEFWAGLPSLLRRDRNFSRFLAARLLLGLGGMGLGFVTAYAVQVWHVGDQAVGGFTAVQLLGQALATLAFGLLADRFGHKVCLEATALCGALAFGAAWLAPGGWVFFLVFFLLGMAAGGLLISGILLALELAEPGRQPTYVGISNTGIGIVSMASPLLGAGLAAVGYPWLFLASAVIYVLAMLAFRFGVVEPRHLSRTTIVPALEH
jgi:MFS family permease